MLRNLRYYWRTNLAVVVGVIAGTAVIGGALVVGDSVRGSLRQMSLDRLGRIDDVLTGPRFFREDLAQRALSPARRSKSGFPPRRRPSWWGARFWPRRARRRAVPAECRSSAPTSVCGPCSEHGDVPVPREQDVVLNDAPGAASGRHSRETA